MNITFNIECNVVMHKFTCIIFLLLLKEYNFSINHLLDIGHSMKIIINQNFYIGASLLNAYLKKRTGCDYLGH